jgi:hypothetical protein
MFESYRRHPIGRRCELFVTKNRARFTTEPDLAELMGDPMTQALMAADRVDRQKLCELLSQVRETLR